MPSLHQASPSRLKLPRSRQRAQTPVWLLPVYPACRQLQVAGCPDRKQYAARSTHRPRLDHTLLFCHHPRGRKLLEAWSVHLTSHQPNLDNPSHALASTRVLESWHAIPIANRPRPPLHRGRPSKFQLTPVSPSVPHAPTCPSWVASTWVGRPPSPSAAAASCHCQIQSQSQSQSTKSWLGATPLQSRCPQAHDGTKWHADPWRCVVPVRVYDANW